MIVLRGESGKIFDQCTSNTHTKQLAAYKIKQKTLLYPPSASLSEKSINLQVKTNRFIKLISKQIYKINRVYKAAVKRRLTSLAGAVPEARSGAVADKPVPSLLTHAAVLAGAAVALLPRHLAARWLDASRVLRLRNLPDVLAASVDEQVPDAAHVAVVEHSGPELGREHQARPAVGQTSQVKVPFQVQDLVFPTGCERGPAAVHRDDAWVEETRLLFLFYFILLKSNIICSSILAPPNLYFSSCYISSHQL